MIRDTFSNIQEGIDVRQNLIQLKAELKEGFNKNALLFQLGADFTVFEELLNHEDAKIRKNTALVIGELTLPGFLNKLYEAYEKEPQLFVKPSYLTAMKNYDYSCYLKVFKEKLNLLSTQNTDESNKKHVNEEMRNLNELIIAVEGVKQHTFIGFNIPSSLVLLTNRNYASATLEQMKGQKAKEFNAGVIVKTDRIKEIQTIRTYSELLFMLEDVKTCENNIQSAAKTLAESSLLTFLKERHKEEAPFYFRIELKGKMDLDKKSAFTKKLGMEIESLTNRKLINSTSNYELEIRMIENKEGSFNILIKLYTLKDERFSYRKNVVAASIQPVNAALFAELTKDYLYEEAQVLDPFCGVGTMLIERHKKVPAGTMYGLDIYSDAIDKAKINTREAHAVINYINRDFFDFKHEYLFDEIFTNMPRVMGHKEDTEIFEIYRRFFQKAPLHMKKDGVIILYSHNRELVKKLLIRDRYHMEKEFEISKKEGAYLYVIRVK